MRTRKPFLIFWPQYFDAKKSRSDGRRLPRKFAIDKVNLEEIVIAAKNLGYHAEIERGYKYPKTWWEDPGRVIVDAQGKKKNKIMLEIAKELRKIQLKT